MTKESKLVAVGFEPIFSRMLLQYTIHLAAADLGSAAATIAMEKKYPFYCS